MSYLGQTTLKSSDIRRVDVTSSTSATHTLTWTAPNEQSLIVTINGVKQQNNYTVSGTTLTLDTALVATDELEVIGINDIGTTITPADGSVNTTQLANDAVATAKIQDDAVTADKLANSINTEIAANTAKVTNATHTGDVTGATALTIANDAVDIAMLSATGTASATTFLRGDNAWAEAGGGKVLQITSDSSNSDESTTSSSRTATSHSISITPTAASNKIIVTLGGGSLGNDVGAKTGFLYIERTDPSAATFGTINNRVYAASSNITAPCALTIVDTSVSTAEHTYTCYISTDGGGTVRFNQHNDTSYMVAWELDES